MSNKKQVNKESKQKDRLDKRADALRENLKRRKERQRALRDESKKS